MAYQRTYSAKQHGVVLINITITPQIDIAVHEIATAVYDIAKDIDNNIYTSITGNKHTKELVKLAFENFDKQCDVLYKNKCYTLNELYIEMDVPNIYAALPFIHCTTKNDDATIQIETEYENTFIKTDEVNLLITQILHKALDDSCEIEIEFYNEFETKNEFLRRVNTEHCWLNIL